VESVLGGGKKGKNAGRGSDDVESRIFKVLPRARRGRRENPPREKRNMWVERLSLLKWGREII